MNLDDLKDTIKNIPSLTFCREYLFSPDSWIFNKESGLNIEGDYHSFQCTIAKIINENPNNISIVGSAKFGFSLKPEATAFKAFNNNSDIDIVIVSHKLFYKVWNGYRRAYYNGYYNLNDKYSKDIFRNFVILYTEEHAEYKSIYLRKIWLKMQSMAKEVALYHRITYPIKFRIYASWGDVENYHVGGIERLKKELSNGS